MSLSARRMRSIGWLALLAVCATLVMVLTLRVNALRSQVRHEENRIIALREETTYLQTEFETRASQQQLKAWNDVDFGYVAPMAGQYLENERQLAMLGKPAAPDAPAPVRLAELGDGAGEGSVQQASIGSGFPSPGFPSMVSPLTGKPMGGAVRSDAVSRNLADTTPLAADTAGAQPADGDRPRDHAAAAAALGERLGHVDHGDGRIGHAKAKTSARKPAKTSEKTADKHGHKGGGTRTASASKKSKAAAKSKAKTPATAKKTKSHSSEDQA